MSYRGLRNWPPNWIHTDRLTGSRVGTLQRMEIGILTHVIAPRELSNRIFLVMKHKNTSYRASLRFDDLAFRNELVRILDFYLGRPIQEIGNMDLDQTL
jgi:hypothetical protein